MRKEGILYLKTEQVEIHLGPKPPEMPAEPPAEPSPEPAKKEETNPRRRLPSIYSHPSLKKQLGQDHPDNR